MRPIERLDKLGLLGPEFIAIHGVHMSDDDIDRLAALGRLARALPAFEPQARQRHRPGRRDGVAKASTSPSAPTEPPATTGSTCLAEGRLTALLAKAETGDAAVFDAHRTLHAMTRAGADALGLGDRIGSIEPGKQADLDGS